MENFNMKTKTMILLIVTGCFFITCNNKNPVDSQNIKILTFTNSENIDSTQTWKSNEIHIIQKTIAINNAILTIEPGAKIKF